MPDIHVEGRLLVYQILYRRWLKCQREETHTDGHCKACGVHI